MYIGIFSKLSNDKNPPMVVYYDANRIVKVCENEGGEGCIFWFNDGDVGGALPYEAPSYTPAGLIELILTARLHPAQFMPSGNVGKAEAAGRESTGSFHWSANDKKK